MRMIIVLICTMFLIGCSGKPIGPKDAQPAAGCPVVEISEHIKNIDKLETDERRAKRIVFWNEISKWEIFQFHCGEVLVLRNAKEIVATFFPDGSVVPSGMIDSLDMTENTKKIFVKAYTCRLKQVKSLEAKKKTGQELTNNDLFSSCSD